MKNRKCVKCGTTLTEQDVMKIKIEDGSWEIIPLSVCPNCFKEQMRELAEAKRKEPETP